MPKRRTTKLVDCVLCKQNQTKKGNICITCCKDDTLTLSSGYICSKIGLQQAKIDKTVNRGYYIENSIWGQKMTAYGLPSLLKLANEKLKDQPERLKKLKAFEEELEEKKKIIANIMEDIHSLCKKLENHIDFEDKEIKELINEELTKYPRHSSHSYLNHSTVNIIVQKLDKHVKNKINAQKKKEEYDKRKKEIDEVLNEKLDIQKTYNGPFYIYIKEYKHYLQGYSNLTQDEIVSVVLDENEKRKARIIEQKARRDRENKIKEWVTKYINDNCSSSAKRRQKSRVYSSGAEKFHSIQEICNPYIKNNDIPLESITPAIIQEIEKWEKLLAIKEKTNNISITATDNDLKAGDAVKNFEKMK